MPSDICIRFVLSRLLRSDTQLPSHLSRSRTIHYCLRVPTELVIRKGRRPARKYHIISPLFLLLKKGPIATWVVPGLHPSLLCPLLCSNLIMSHTQITRGSVLCRVAFLFLNDFCLWVGSGPPNGIYTIPWKSYKP